MDLPTWPAEGPKEGAKKATIPTSGIASSHCQPHPINNEGYALTLRPNVWTFKDFGLVRREARSRAVVGDRLIRSPARRAASKFGTELSISRTNAQQLDNVITEVSKIVNYLINVLPDSEKTSLRWRPRYGTLKTARSIAVTIPA